MILEDHDNPMTHVKPVCHCGEALVLALDGFVTNMALSHKRKDAKQDSGRVKTKYEGPQPPVHLARNHIIVRLCVKNGIEFGRQTSACDGAEDVVSE